MGTRRTQQLKGGDLGNLGGAGDDSQDTDYPLGGHGDKFDVLAKQFSFLQLIY